LTEAQEDAIEEIIEKSQEERSRLRSSIASGQTADPEFKKRGALQEQETKEAVKVLTDEQKRAWKDLIGKEIAPETLLSISGPGMGFGRGGSVQFGGGGGGPGGGGGGGFGGGGGVPNPALEKKKTKP
jgi:DnaJ-class molecular chaperone